MPRQPNALADRTLVISGASRGYDLSRYGGGPRPIPDLFIA